ncbi:NlpC/P60 family protein [Actinokineospora alba]|uniref:NlpC/P60 family protein n=1 Tax=Actinokineospora alba TaxID=504798 RepID=A0A1H0VXI6_9PSEU|nr:C40 family peptidase [Actinokineospora alba]TDP67129.1 NlpC/P60 family protein [Actinokineospora alba]SDJ46195.1 NlpC/P60 family protein [Actinokineospora alba]SDP83063.1 NlpC/P60 family protein [Actinokineospora alba]
MRATVMIGALAAGGLVVAITAGVVTVVQKDQMADAMRVATMSCNATLGPATTGPAGSGAGDAARLTDEQRGTVAHIIAIGKQRNLAPRAWQVAIQAGMTESGLRSLNYGDRDSLGIFQMRPSMGWGSPAQVTDPVYAVNKFYDVLLKVPNWENQRPGESAQDVERSAFPDRYHRWEAMAAHLIGTLGEVVNATGCGQGVGNLLPAPTAAAGAAINWALGQQGKPYQWGALTTHQNSFDCSSLMLQAYRSSGITLPRTSREQYRAGAMLPVEQAQPGDLLFWAYDENDPRTIHHVAMYLGDGKIVEAQQDGVPVHIRPVSWTEGELVNQAVRPGV